MSYLEQLRREFNGHIAFRTKRPGVIQVLAPLFHEDGDMIDLFLEPEPPDDSGRILITDHGLTLMRLSYHYDLDTPNKRRIFDRIIAENRMSERDGRLSLMSEPENLYAALLQFAQTVAKVSSMQLYKREVIESLFFEALTTFVEERLVRYRPTRSFLPVPERDDLEVDFSFAVKPRPIYLFGVRDNAHARLATISCLEFRSRKLPFKSVIVHEDFENKLTKKDRTRITSAADKQFPSLDDFTQHAEEFFEREAVA